MNADVILALILVFFVVVYMDVVFALSKLVIFSVLILIGYVVAVIGFTIGIVEGEKWLATTSIIDSLQAYFGNLVTYIPIASIVLYLFFVAAKLNNYCELNNKNLLVWFGLFVVVGVAPIGLTLMAALVLNAA